MKMTWRCKYVLPVILGCLVFLGSASSRHAYSDVQTRGETVRSATVFNKWISAQAIREDVSFGSLVDDVTPDSTEYFIKQVPPAMRTQLLFMFPRTMRFTDMTSDEIGKVATHLKKMAGFLESNIPGFVDYLAANKFTTAEINQADVQDMENGRLSDVYQKYRRFLESMMFHGDMKKYYSSLNGIANRFLEYCFYPKTHAHFRNILDKTENHAVVRFLYEIIWYYLARSEWRSWHQNTLDNLKREYDQGKEIVYIAGGSDIYQLLKRGIYRIRNIDPLYPTQTKYYSEGWDFLAVGKGAGSGIGDRIVFDQDEFSGRKLVMRRISYKRTGTLLENVEIAETNVSIPKSETVWSIEDGDGKRLGTYTLERRFCTQNDFVTGPGRALLISFNELYFIVTKNDENWGIKPELFAENFKFHVKQVRAPLSREVIMNMRAIQGSKYPNRFGSSVIGH